MLPRKDFRGGWILLGLVLELLLAGCAPQPTFDGLEIRPPKQLVDPLDSATLDNLSAQELTARGQEYQGKGAYRVASVYYVRAIAKDKSLIAPYLGQAQLALLDGQSERARELYDLALAQDPEALPALLGAGRVARGTDNEAALAYFQRALALAPDDPAILTEVAITHDGMAQLPEAEALYREVLAQRPSAASHNNLGFNLLLQGRYGEAIPLLRTALQKDATNPRSLNNLAVAYFLSGQKGKALALFKDAVGLAGAYNNLGYFHMLAGRYDAAQEAFRHAMELHPRYYVRAQKNLEQLQLLRDDELSGRQPIQIRLSGSKGPQQPLPKLEGWTTFDVPPQH